MYIIMYKNFFSFILVVAIFATTMSSCNSDDDDDNAAAVTFTVSFESNGGSEVDDQSVNSGAFASEPNPTRTGGYVFDGWYTDDETFENRWDFASSAVTEDITLYAKWVKPMLLEIFTDEYGSVTKFEYDAQNRLVKVTNNYVESGNPGLTHSIEYKANGIVDVTTADPSDMGFTLFIRLYEVTTSRVTTTWTAWDNTEFTETIDLDAGLPVEIVEKNCSTKVNVNKSAYTYIGSNLTKMERWVLHDAEHDDDCEYDEEELGDLVSIEYSNFDDKKSPFYYCASPKWIIARFVDNAYLSQNNARSVNLTEPTTITYTYDADSDLPLTRKTGTGSDENFEYIPVK